MRKDKAIWFIDAAYLLKAQESVDASYQFDYLKLRNKLEEDGTIDRAYYLNCTPNPPSDGQNDFHTWLQRAKPTGPQLIVELYSLADKDFECPHCGEKFTKPVQKGVDVGLATLIVKLAYQDDYDTLILSSGDSDLLDAIKHVKGNLKKRFELCVFKHGVSPKLQPWADKIHWINDFHTEVLKPPKQSKP